jgi:poly-gamma-glutamate capsule biosynthesis protein CapA/YwtB (metallophosphatase superfamily)
MDMGSEKLTIGFAGDVMIGRGVNAIISKTGYSYIWGDVLPLLRDTDINIINLETTLTSSEKEVFKVFNFKAAPDRIISLREARITIVNLANNHILDFSEEGLIETIQLLNSAGIFYTGAGINDKEAAKAAIVIKKNTAVGVIGFTDNEPGWNAGVSSSGVNYIDILESNDRYKALLQIEQLREEADIVIVSIHWGPNMCEEPSREFIVFAHEIIDAGADIIHGHSAHNFQAIEIYNGKIILYDTGDFVDDYRVDPWLRNDRSFLFWVEADKQHIRRLELIPVLISGCRVNLAKGEDYKWSMQRMQQLSAKFKTNLNNKGEVILH